MKSFLGLIGRIALSLSFIFEAAYKIINWEEGQDAILSALITWFDKTGELGDVHRFVEFLIPLAPFILVGSVFFQGAGGLLMFTGFRARLGAVFILISLICTTLLFHPFWLVEEFDQGSQLPLFLKNLSLIGALLLFLASSNKEEKKVKETA